MFARDIVDTEPSDGDIYQMLLGSVSDEADGRNDPSDWPSPPLDGAPHIPAHHRGSSGSSVSRLRTNPDSNPSFMQTVREY
jgi:hypothetical protein